MSSSLASATASAVSSIVESVSASASASSASASAASASASGSSASSQPASFKVVGVLLAVGSGLFIGSSFVFKKKGLLSSQQKAGTVAGEGHEYLKSPMWWTGMTLMIVGEILNFVAYAFTEAILVTPLGALSVVICAILSSIFLKEKLTFFGKIGCVLCILGAVGIALNGPQEQSVTTIVEFQKLFLAPGFLVFGSVLIITSLVLIFWAAPRYGKKNMLVYIMVCSLIGGLSVSSTQGLGSSIVTSIRGDNQFKHWFIYFLLVFVICTLLTEINYLNKALELFNTAMVTPTYYVIFTFSTLVTSVILYQGFKASAVQIITVVISFFVICCGITLLQMSKIEPEKLNLDRKSTILLKAAKAEIGDAEKGESTAIEDPGIDALRGSFGAFGSLYRARSARRSVASREAIEARRRSRLADPSRGDDSLVRYQLSDAPMPDDALERISMYSGPGPTSPGGTAPRIPDAANRTRSTSIRFDPEQTAHYYPADGKPGVVVHQYHQRAFRDHDGPALPSFQPPSEEDDYDDDEKMDLEENGPPSIALTRASYRPDDKNEQMWKNSYPEHELDLDRGPKSATLPRGNPPASLAQVFKSHFASSTPDLGKSTDDLDGVDRKRSGRGTAERGTKAHGLHFGRDKATSPTRHSHDQGDSEERQGLVSRAEDSDDEDRSKSSRPGDAV